LLPKSWKKQAGGRMGQRLERIVRHSEITKMLFNLKLENSYFTGQVYF